MIAHLFALRFAGARGGDILVWRLLVAFLLAKKQWHHTMAVKDFIVVTRSAFMGKWYMMDVMLLTIQKPLPLDWRNVCIAGVAGNGDDSAALLVVCMRRH